MRCATRQHAAKWRALRWDNWLWRHQWVAESCRIQTSVWLNHVILEVCNEYKHFLT